MVKVEINGIERYYDGILKDNLDIIKKKVSLKWDGVIYVGGYEGDGKSWLAAQIALYFDNTYCLPRCVFNPKQFLDAVDEATIGQAIVYDEAQDAFESTNRDKLSKAVKSKLTRIRRKQLYIIIVAPDFWRINKYLFIHRSLGFLRVYADGLSRGFFSFYNRDRKHNLFIKGKRTEELVVPPNFKGRFTKWFPLDHDEYEKKKEEATEEINLDDDVKICKADRKKLLREGALSLFQKLERNQWLRHGFTREKLASLLGVSRKTVYSDITQMKNSSLDGGKADFSGSEKGGLITNNLKGGAKIDREAK